MFEILPNLYIFSQIIQFSKTHFILLLAKAPSQHQSNSEHEFESNHLRISFQTQQLVRKRNRACLSKHLIIIISFKISYKTNLLNLNV